MDGLAKIPPPPADRRGRWIWLGALAVLLVVAGAAALLLPRYVRSRIERQARAAGIELEFRSLELGLRHVRLVGVRFSLAEVTGFAGTMDSATVDLSGLSPTRVAGEGLSIELIGTAFVKGLSHWGFQRPDVLPFAAGVAHVTWRLRARDEAPFAEIAGGRLTSEPGSSSETCVGALAGGRLGVGTRSFGAVDLAFELAGTKTAAPDVAIGLGATEVQRAPLRLEARVDAFGTGLHFVLQPTRAATLATIAGVVLPAPNATVEGTLDGPLPELDPPGPYGAKFSLAIDGWTPPHPKELDGIVFGEHTTVEGSVRLAEDLVHADVDDLRVAAGALKLSGTATLRPAPSRGPGTDESALVRADLNGAIPCSMLAGSAAAARLGKTLGDFAGNLARRTLAGSVSVRIHVEADTRALGAARIEPSAVLGCKLALL